MIKTAVITDAGIANRYMPYTKTIPKGMIPMGNKPVMHLVVEECLTAGIDKAIIITDEKGKRLYTDYFLKKLVSSKNSRLKESSIQELENIQMVSERIEFEILIQPEDLPYGNGTPLLSVQDKLKSEPGFLYLYSDNVIFGGETTTEALVDMYKDDDTADAYIAVKKVTEEQIVNHASIVIDNENEYTIARLVEKPKAGKAPSLLASYGRYLLTNKIFDYLNKESLGKNNELWTSYAISKMAQNGKVKYVVPENICMTTGDPDNYLKTCIEYHKRNEF
ncbi:hypothetical protein GF389_02685 [Candidatus Dojkabacteria bacterium]|nr:hypothetical protein [Candidatus Dojkabacteria bacterium]